MQPHFIRIGMTNHHKRPLPELMPRILAAVELLMDSKCDIVVFQCTGTSMSGGVDMDKMVVGEIAKTAKRPAISTASAVNAALGALNAKRLVFISETKQKGHDEKLKYMREAGYDIVADRAASLEGTDAYCTTPPRFWYDMALALKDDRAAGLLSLLRQHPRHRCDRGSGEGASAPRRHQQPGGAMVRAPHHRPCPTPCPASAPSSATTSRRRRPNMKSPTRRDAMLPGLGPVTYWVTCICLVLCIGSLALVHAGEVAPMVEVVAMGDGSVEVEGSRFTDTELLKAKLLEIRDRNPAPEFRFRIQEGADIRGYAQAIILVQNTGVLKLGFVISPPK